MKKQAIFAAVLCFSSTVLAGTYSGGDGTAEYPYQIADVNDLLELSATTADYNKNFILTADINLTGRTFTQAPIAPDTDSETDEFQGTQFTGVFDGDSHTISNLTITVSTQDYIGLFGSVGFGSQIHNLGVENVNITGRDYVGGLVGNNDWGTLTVCYATGTVNGNSSVGGLVGYNAYYQSIAFCYATGAVNGTSRIGGLAGSNKGLLTSCYATSAVSGTDSIGGLVGLSWRGSLTNCYASGSVSGTGYNVGGLVGWTYFSYLTTCFWDIQTSGQTVAVGSGIWAGKGAGKTTSEMKTLSTFTSVGWDFASIWAMPLGQYPVLFLRQMGDLNSDARVDMQDLAILAANWLEGI